jgi:hypothetical protein
MNTIQDLNLWVKDQIKANPHLEAEIFDLFDLCIQEIENGEGISTRNEIDLCIFDIKELIRESK